MNAATPAANGPGPALPAARPPGAQTILESVMSETERYRLALEPNTQDEGWAVAEAAKAAGLVPSAEEGFARILIGRPLGIPAMASIQGIALIENKSGGKTACMYAKLKLGLLQSRKDIVEYIRPKGPGALSNTEATWIAKRVGDPEPVEYKFTIEDARIAGLVGRGDAKNAQGQSMNNYDRHPGPMLQWRSCGRLCDIIGADVLNALATREDIEDELRMARAELEELAAAAGRGELTKALDAPPQAKAAKDFAAEASALKKQLTDALAAKSKPAMAAFRKAYDAFKGDAPAELSEEIQRFYSTEVGNARKAAKPDSAAAIAPPPSPPAAAPAAPPSAPAAATASPYLPPRERGDSYDGPDEPEPPFG